MLPEPAKDVVSFKCQQQCCCVGTWLLETFRLRNQSGTAAGTVTEGCSLRGMTQAELGAHVQLLHHMFQ